MSIAYILHVGVYNLISSNDSLKLSYTCWAQRQIYSKTTLRINKGTRSHTHPFNDIYSSSETTRERNDKEGVPENGEKDESRQVRQTRNMVIIVYIFIIYDNNMFNLQGTNYRRPTSTVEIDRHTDRHRYIYITKVIVSFTLTHIYCSLTKPLMSLLCCTQLAN